MSNTTAAPPVSLGNDEILRYSRHLIMPEVGMAGQLRSGGKGRGGLSLPLIEGRRIAS